MCKDTFPSVSDFLKWDDRQNSCDFGVHPLAEENISVLICKRIDSVLVKTHTNRKCGIGPIR